MATRRVGSKYVLIQSFCIAFLTFVLILSLSSPAAAQDFSATTTGNFGDITVMTVSGNYDAETPDGTPNAGPRQEIAKAFFQTHADDYDFLVIFSNFDFQMPAAETVAFYMGVRNDTAGIGQAIFDNSELYGSTGKLQGTIDMGNLDDLVSDPLDPGFSFTMGVLSHELAHRWSTYIKFRQQDGTLSAALLGKDQSHWSFLLDTAGSLQYGNHWLDNQDGSFTSLPGRKYYSPLDLYLMGFVDKSAVAPMLLIENPAVDPQRISEEGITIDGTARQVTIDDIIAAEGDRNPSAEHSQKSFKIGTIFITTPDSFTGDELYAIRTIMRQWVLWFSSLTDGQGFAVLDVAPAAEVAANPGITPPAHVPRSTPPQITGGIAWLVENQQENGSWQDTLRTIERDTADAVTALTDVSDAQSSVVKGHQWLTDNAPANLDFLARTIETLSAAGQTVAGLLDELTARQNPDGGWGGNPGYVSNPADTALALKALAAAGSANAAALDAAVNYLKTRQNTDGGWGIDDGTSSIQITADTLSAFGRLQDAYAVADSMQTALAWLTGKQNPDGGYGNSPSTVYDTAAAMLVLPAANPAPPSAAAALNYLLALQSQDGSWYASAFQTARAVAALSAWQDSIDPDLTITAADIQFSPATVTELPGTITIDAVIRNSGLVAVPEVRVVLYDGAVSEAAVVAEQNLAVPAQGSAAAAFSVTIFDTQSHQYYVAVDPAGLVAESSETNNTAVSVLINDVNTDPDLAISSTDITFDPANVSRLPSVVAVDVLVHNTGLGQADGATVALYENAVSGPNKLDQQTLSLGPQSSQPVSFAVNISDGSEHRYYVVADPANAIAEKSEFNNTAIKILYPAATHDFAIKAADIVLSETAVIEDQTVTITASVRNTGTRDAYDVPLKFFIADAQDPVDIALLTVDLPAGGALEKTVTWQAARRGVDLPLSVTVDPEGAWTELSEDNNTAAVPLTVNPHPEPNLTLTYDNITVSPLPALQAGTAAISALIQNDGGSAATGFQVDFYLGAPAAGGELIGSRSVATLAAGAGTTLELEWTPIPQAGDHLITVVADAAHQVAEVSETDNSAFRAIKILSLPDFVVSGSAVVLSPATPRETEPLTVAVTVQNAGQQDGENVRVSLTEAGAIIAAGSIDRIAGNSQETIEFVYDTAGKPGAHTLRVVVDPGQLIAEQNEDNNAAERSFGVQQEDQILTNSYISHDAGDAAGQTQFIFRLESSRTVRAVIVDAAGNVVRTYSGAELEDITGGAVTWNGRDEMGVIVADGIYHIRLLDENGRMISSLPVTVDNNRSPITEAIGTADLLQTNLTCLLPELRHYRWQWFGDESGIVFHLEFPDPDAPEYPTGIYTMAPDGEDIRRIVPWEWNETTDPKYIYRFNANYGEDSFISPDDRHMAFVLQKRLRSGNRLLQSQLYVTDRNGENLTLLDSVDYQDENGNNSTGRALQTLSWSPDNETIAYIISA